MTDRKKNPCARGGASGARKPNQSAAEGKCKLARQKRAVTFTVTPHDLDAAQFTIFVSGRILWALERLLAAGPRGCSPISNLHPDGPPMSTHCAAWACLLRRSTKNMKATFPAHMPDSFCAYPHTCVSDAHSPPAIASSQK